MKRLSEDWNPSIAPDGKTYIMDSKDVEFKDGKLEIKWKLNDVQDLPSIIMIDEALQFTLPELMLIDKFAKKYGIPVVMSGDLQLSKTQGEIKLPDADIDEITKEVKAKNPSFPTYESVYIGLSRNLTLHTFKLGTSMRTANNLKNSNISVLQEAMISGNTDIALHYYWNEQEGIFTGDKIVSPTDIDSVTKILDAVIPQLESGEKIKFAYNNTNGQIYQRLKDTKKYADYIEFIQGTALGQEGNYWIFEPPVGSSEGFINDFYTGITRSKKGSIVVSENSTGRYNLTNILDKETHEISYSKDATKKAAKNKVDILNEVVKNAGTIEYKPRTIKGDEANNESSIEPNNPSNNPPSGPTNNPPSNNNPQSITLNPNGPTPVNPESSSEINSKELIDDIFVVADNSNNLFGFENTEQIYIKNKQGLWIPLSATMSNGYILNSGEEIPGGGLIPGPRLLAKNRTILIYDGAGGYFEVSIDNVVGLYRNKQGKHIDITEEVQQEVEKLLQIEKNIVLENSEIDTIDNLDENEIISSKERKQQLNKETEEANPDSDIDMDPVGLSLEQMKYFLFTNATFEYGTNKIDLLNKRIYPSDIPGRIDGVNGFLNIPKYNLNGSQNGYSLSTVETVIGNLRKLLLNVKDKAQLELEILDYLELEGGVYVRFAIKTSETDGYTKSNDSRRSKYGKLDKDPDEPVPYSRTKNTEGLAKLTNTRSLIAIIGSNGKDAIEIPLITLNNPITILMIKEDDGSYRYKDVHDVYLTAHDAKYQSSRNYGEAQIEGLKKVINTFENDPRYKAFINLAKMYVRTNRWIAFVKDLGWTIAKNLRSFGPQMHKHRGDPSEYENKAYIQEGRYISLNEFKKDPTLKVTSFIYRIEDKGEAKKLGVNAKHPFVLYTDLYIDHNGETLESDESLINEYLWQRSEEAARLGVTKSIKLVYVLPPEYTILEYIDSVARFMEDNKGKPLGNQRTAYNIIESIIDNPRFGALLDSRFGSGTYNLIKSIINNLRNLSIEDQVRELQRHLKLPLQELGLTTEIPLYRHFLHILKQLVYPGGVTFDGGVLALKLKSGGRVDEDFKNELQSIFQETGKSLFYQAKPRRGTTIASIFTQIDTDIDNNIVDDNISNKGFQINGNLSSSTYLAEEELNNIIDDIVNNLLFSISSTQWGSVANSAYLDGNSGWNTTTLLEPSLAPEVTDKLSRKGITTTVQPISVNDKSNETLSKIAEEINTRDINHLAFVINGELIIGDFSHNFAPKFNYNNWIESNQQYQLTMEDDGKVYDVEINPTNKMVKITERSFEPKVIVNNNSVLYTDAEVEITLEHVLNNLERFKELLDVIQGDNEISLWARDQAKILLSSLNPLLIAEYFNSDYIYGIKGAIEDENFDASNFIDILGLEDNVQQEEQNVNCKIPINILFI